MVVEAASHFPEHDSAPHNSLQPALPPPAGAQGLPGPPRLHLGAAGRRSWKISARTPTPGPGAGKGCVCPPTWADPAEASPAPLTPWHQHPTPRQ